MSGAYGVAPTAEDGGGDEGMLSPGLHYLRLGQAPALVIALGNC